MRTLVIEDDMTCRTVMEAYLTPYGECHVVENGQAGLAAIEEAWTQGKPYDLACLDIFMPGMDGQEVLARIRQMEQERGIAPEQKLKVIMTSGSGDMDHIAQSFEKECVAYIVKPVLKAILLDNLRELKLIP